MPPSSDFNLQAEAFPSKTGSDIMLKCLTGSPNSQQRDLWYLTGYWDDPLTSSDQTEISFGPGAILSDLGRINNGFLDVKSAVWLRSQVEYRVRTWPLVNSMYTSHQHWLCVGNEGGEKYDSVFSHRWASGFISHCDLLGFSVFITFTGGHHFSLHLLGLK